MDKSRLSSTESVFVSQRLIIPTGFSFHQHFSSSGSPQTRASAGSPTTSPSSRSTLQAWRPSRGPKP